MSVITIARQLGAGGKTLGETVANQLGYDFYDNEIIQMVAEQARVSTDVIVSAEKNVDGKFKKLMSSLVPKTFADRVQENDQGVINEEIYVDHLTTIIKQIASQGNVVILGRGGQYILESAEDAHHVLLIADSDHRRKFLAKKYDLSYDQAMEAMDVEDKRREHLYRKFGRDDYDHWSNYDIIINMTRISLQKAVDQICMLAG
jgi:cytidylate kinase